MARNQRTSATVEDKSRLLDYVQIKIESNKQKKEALKTFKGEMELPTIHRVPDVFHEMNKLAYAPSVVAIGPLHRANENLQAMEAVKLTYMDFLLDRTRNSKKALKECVAAMLEKEPFARKCYAEGTERAKTTQDAKLAENERFAEMMLIDGCFMIELFYRGYKEETDAIVANTFKLTAIEHDLLLLENQLPFFILEKLFTFTIQQIPENCNCHRPSLTECVLSFFGDVLRLECDELSIRDNSTTPGYILHLLHSCYLPAGKEAEMAVSHKLEKEKTQDENREEEKKKTEVLKNFKYSATELDLGGIKFMQGNRDDIFDFKFKSCYHCHLFFCKRGEFKIPPLMVNDYTELLLRNFIAFEQSCPLLVKPYFTSHAFLMDRLMNTAEDVKLLEKAGIICNVTGSREEVASLFNNVCKNITIDSLYSTQECLEVIIFHKRLWPKFQVKLRRDYFSNPWSIISVGAAVVLFLFALMQIIHNMRRA